ncbi:MAG: N-6 DNA methylase, partial [Spirochaetales bacterium]|nr:N-6 DNA methylase [Spirochaetales bacterium]
EADLLETIVALPNDMFYNTGIATYVWILSNKKSKEREGKIQLINGVNLYGKMRKSLGSKRNIMGEDDIAVITRCFGNFEVVDARELDKPVEVKSNRGRQSENGKTTAPKTFGSKIFNYYEFGYRRITVERPLRESYQFSDERIEELRFASKPLGAAMKWIYSEYGQNWPNKTGGDSYGILKDYDEDIRKHIKTNFSTLKEKQIKDLLHRKIWIDQRNIMLKAKELQQVIGSDQYDDMNDYDAVLKSTGIKLEAKEKKLITSAVSWKNPDAKKVIKKIHKGKANPIYGFFEVDGQVVEYKSDGDLRDNENISLDPSRSVNETNEAYFAKEVLPHVPEAWIDGSKKDAKDQEIGIVGYEIPFNRHFYVYQPPRDLAEIDAELDQVSAEIMELLREVHS